MAPPYRRNAKTNDKDDKKKRPIIVKRVKARAAPPHSSAWKVAYADFVTAMMAFFLLLWLLSTSSKATLEGLAEYFSPTTGIGDMRPIGIDPNAPRFTTTTPIASHSAAGIATQATENISPAEAEEEENLFEQGAQAISQALRDQAQLEQYKDNIAVSNTPEGLRVDLKDSDKYPMFNLASSELTEHGRTVLERLVPLLKRMPNYMSVSGFTAASSLETQAVSRWQLSASRADAALSHMLQTGLEAERPLRIVGSGDSELVEAGTPRSARNRRVSILMLRGSHILIPSAAIPGAPAR